MGEDTALALNGLNDGSPSAKAVQINFVTLRREPPFRCGSWRDSCAANSGVSSRDSSAAMGQTSVIIGRERRRRFTEEQKFDLLTVAFGPGGNVAEVARGADIATSLLYRWRRAHLAPQAPAFVPAVMKGDGRTITPCSGSEATIVVELMSGATVRISPAAEPALVAATLRALR